MTERLLALAGLSLALSTLPAAAQIDYPNRQIRFVVPYAAGGIADLLARALAQGLGPELKQTIVIENQTGAGGHVGAAAAVKAPADGYTLVLATIAHNGAASMYQSLTYNPDKDMKPVILIAESAGVLIVHDSVAAKTVTELIALSKSPGANLNYGSAGHGSALHLAAELFKSLTGAPITHVPYRGSAPALQDLLGGQIQVMFENISTALPHIGTGKIRPLGVTSPTPAPSLSDVPTIAASGVPGYQAVPWYTVSVASGVPADVVAKLNASLDRVIQQPDLTARWRQLGVTPLGGSVAAAEARNAAERTRWGEVIAKAGIKAE